MNEKYQSNNPQKKDSLSFGITLVVIGGAFLLHQFKIIDLFHLPMHWWELAAIFVGLMACFSIFRAKNEQQLASGIFNIGLAIWLYVTFEKLWGFNLNNSWPILLIGYGAGHVIAAMFKKNSNEHENSQQINK